MYFIHLRNERLLFLEVFMVEIQKREGRVGTSQQEDFINRAIISFLYVH